MEGRGGEGRIKQKDFVEHVILLEDVGHVVKKVSFSSPVRGGRDVRTGTYTPFLTKKIKRKPQHEYAHTHNVV